MLSLRVLTANDWPLWRAARLAALAEAPHAFRSRLADWDRGGEERWRARFDRPDTHNVVALRDGRTAGMASGVPADDGTAGLRSVWVSPEARGRGVADRLLAAVENWARDTGAPELELTVIPGNGPALALYRRHGYTDTGRPGALLTDGVSREAVLAKALR